MTHKYCLFSYTCVLTFLCGMLIFVSAANAASQPATFGPGESDAPSPGGSRCSFHDND